MKFLKIKFWKIAVKTILWTLKNILDQKESSPLSFSSSKKGKSSHPNSSELKGKGKLKYIPL